MPSFAPEYKDNDPRLIIREDYRVYRYVVDPWSSNHANQLSEVQKKVNAYFESRDIPVERMIKRSAQGKRMYWIHFSTLADSEMFYIALAEHITTKGVKFP